MVEEGSVEVPKAGEGRAGVGDGLARHSECVGVGRSRVVVAREPRAGFGEVVVEVGACGVCASEVVAWRDAKIDPMRFGHEVAGVVSKVGAGVYGYREGDLVTGLMTGGFSEQVVARAEDLCPVPDWVALEHALGEPLACLVEALRRTGAPRRGRVAIVGLGFMGLGFLQVVKTTDPVALVAVDPEPAARDRAVALGATEAYHPEDLPSRLLLDAQDYAGLERGLETVVESSGTAAGLMLAGNMVAAHGTLSILGWHHDGPRTVDMGLWNWKAIDIVNAHVRQRGRLMEGMRDGMGMVADRRFSFEPLITHRFGLDEVDNAFRLFGDRPDDFVKAVIVP